MNVVAKKCLWLVEEIIREDGPRTATDIARTTGLDRRVIDDCCWELIQRGLVRLRPDSKLEWVECIKDRPLQPAYSLDCLCAQHGSYCPEHPNCACGCPKHAHDSTGCIAGSMRCHGCDGYRPAKRRRFVEFRDADLDQLDIHELRTAYRELRAHHIEETTALMHPL